MPIGVQDPACPTPLRDKTGGNSQTQGKEEDKMKLENKGGDVRELKSRRGI